MMRTAMIAAWTAMGIYIAGAGRTEKTAARPGVFVDCPPKPASPPPARREEDAALAQRLPALRKAPRVAAVEPYWMQSIRRSHPPRKLGW